MSTAPTPSTIAWWVLVTIANRSPAEPLDEVHLPQRPAAVERAAHDAADELAQLRVGPGRGSADRRTW